MQGGGGGRGRDGGGFADSIEIYYLHCPVEYGDPSVVAVLLAVRKRAVAIFVCVCVLSRHEECCRHATSSRSDCFRLFHALKAHRVDRAIFVDVTCMSPESLLWLCIARCLESGEFPP